VVAGSLTGILGGWDKSGVGGKTIGIGKRREVPDRGQELGAKQRPHVQKANASAVLPGSVGLVPCSILQTNFAKPQNSEIHLLNFR
jgi:hypothetical protein